LTAKIVQIVKTIDSLQIARQRGHMLKRIAATTLRRLARYYPALVLTGPRQSGKTTLARATFPRKP
jgi:hypothetical protein